MVILDVSITNVMAFLAVLTQKVFMGYMSWLLQLSWLDDWHGCHGYHENHWYPCCHAYHGCQTWLVCHDNNCCLDYHGCHDNRDWFSKWSVVSQLPVLSQVRISMILIKRSACLLVIVVILWLWCLSLHDSHCSANRNKHIVTIYNIIITVNNVPVRIENPRIYFL